MTRKVLLITPFFFAAGLAEAGLEIPSEADLAKLRSMSAIGSTAAAATEPFTVDTSSREETRQFYRAIYGASEGVPIEWTGDITTGDAGDTADAYKEAVLVRVNYFRAMSGVPANVMLNSTFSAKAQQAALMMSANSALSHFPPPGWTFYTDDGAEAAGKSNLAWGSSGPDSITGYMLDHGPNNDVVGHRRWIFYPQTMEMGTGDVPATSGKGAANALWVQDANVFGPRPATRDPYIAWPPRGNVPYQLVFPRWSFSYPGANFSSATVTMSRDGSDVAVQVETRGSGSGLPDSTIVWLYDGKVGTDESSHEKPNSDTTYTVNVNGVIIDGSPQDFQYNVVVFDPDVAGSDYTETSIGGPDEPLVGQGNGYTVNAPAFAGGIRWRSLQFETFTTVFGAEGDLEGVVAETSPGYNVRVTDLVGAGGGAYHLAHPAPAENQYLWLPGLYSVPVGQSGSLEFLSRLGAATDDQTARVQVSTDGGQSWSDVYTQVGSGGSGESGFSQRMVALDSMAGRTFEVRFVYSYPGSGTYFPQTSSSVGWIIDNIELSGVEKATVVDTSEVVAGTHFDFSPAAPETYGVQAQGVLFGEYPLEWGPVLVANAAQGPPPGGNAPIINLSVRSNAGSGDQTLIVGFALGGNGTGSALLRGIGPTLSQFGVSGAMTDPQLTLFADGSVIANNDNWGGGVQLADLFASLGAFGLDAQSLDAATLQVLSSGAYSTHVSTDGDPGVALVEAYDTASGGGTARFVNLSARTAVGTGNDILIAGFVVGGSGSAQLLIRAIGPTLTDFGVGGALADPVLNLFQTSGTMLAENDDWGGDPALVDAFSQTGAFGLPNTSKDAALLVTVQSGGFTAQVSGADGGTGIALVEIYEIVSP